MTIDIDDITKKLDLGEDILEQGSIHKIREIAKSMLKDKVDMNTISKYTVYLLEKL